MKKYEMSEPVQRIVETGLKKIFARVPVSTIKRVSEDYLMRAYIMGNETPDDESGVYLHRFVASDEKARLHRHPWRWSVAFVLVGAYRETRGVGVYRDEKKPNMVKLDRTQTQEFENGEHNFLRASDYHRVELLTDEVWTLFLHGPRVGLWGFIDEHERGWQREKIVRVRTSKKARRPEAGIGESS